MAKLNRKDIQDAARIVLERETGGIRWTQLLRAVEADTPDTPHNTVHGAIHALLNSDPAIVKVARCRATPGNQPQATSGTHPLGIAFHPDWVNTTKV